MKAFIFSLLCLLIPFGFRTDLKKIYFPMPYRSEWDFAPPSNEILSILGQKFSYLSQGSQCLVFESEDQKVVLKILKCSRSPFQGFQQIKNLFKKKPKLSRRKKLQKTCDAVLIAAKEAAHFTQVIYCHLNPTSFAFPKMVLQGKKIELNRCRFVLQKKVQSFDDALLGARNDPEALKRLIDSFFSLIHERASLGIFNSDPNLASNFGFLNGKAVEMDFGNYRKCGINPEREEKEKKEYLKRLSDWLSIHIPEFIE